MRKIFRKNQMIITALAILIAIAGYLNYSGQLLEETTSTVSSDDNTILLTDEMEESTYIDTYTDIVSLDGDVDEESSQEESSEAGTSESAIGEAVLVSTGAVDMSDILAAAKLTREQVRSKSKEELQAIIDSADISDDQKQEAVTAMAELTLNAEKESAAELLLEASGYTDCVVSITNDTADVIVNAAELTEAQRAQIEDIVKRKTEVAGENIVITPAAAVQTTEDAQTTENADTSKSTETTDDSE